MEQIRLTNGKYKTQHRHLKWCFGDAQFTATRWQLVLRLFDST